MSLRYWWGEWRRGGRELLQLSGVSEVQTHWMDGIVKQKLDNWQKSEYTCPGVVVCAHNECCPLCSTA
jgi:hypothetical protein